MLDRITQPMFIGNSMALDMVFGITSQVDAGEACMQSQLIDTACVTNAVFSLKGK